MARIFNQTSLNILSRIAGAPGVPTTVLYSQMGKIGSYKDFYNAVYRLTGQELLERKKMGSKGWCLWVTEDGKKLLGRCSPQRDGIWKLVIFDIPEKQKYVRVVLRAKLKALHFKKWQNSIWISPYALDNEIETELCELAKKFFVRLIKTQDINYTQDLEKLFS
jgi:DNA-binding transcriptional regulator PaaX